MSFDDLTSLAMDVLLEANRVIKCQAEERHIIYRKLVEYSMEHSDKISDDIAQKMEELKEDPMNYNFFKAKKLTALNKLIAQIDMKEQKRDKLLEEVKSVEANIESRNELIEILNEYIKMEEAGIYRLVDNYSEAQEILEESKEAGNIFEILSANDPRIRALRTIQSHENGISIIQLSFMLGTTQYNANKIINELIDMDLITRTDQIIKIVDPNTNAEKSLLNLTV